MEIIEVFSVCTDCMLEIEVGESEHRRGRQFENFCALHGHLHLHRKAEEPVIFEGPGYRTFENADEDGSLGFCTTECEACGDRLHGDRHCIVELG